MTTPLPSHSPRARAFWILATLLLGPASATAQDAERNGGGSRPGSLSFHQQHFPVREDRGPILIAVKRNGGTQGAVSVRYEAKLAAGPGAATTADFTPVSGVLQWLDGERANKSFEVSIADDTEREGIEIFALVLSDPTGGAAIDRRNATARVQILDDDRDGNGGDGAGMLRFDDPEVDAAESSGSASIRVERQGGSSGAITVHYATADGSATAPDDYAATDGILSWADGDSADKTFAVSILDDAVDERRETVRLRLSDPNGGAKIHPVKGRSVLTIVDNDDATGAASGVVRFERRRLRVREDLDAVTVVVERTRGSEGAIQVAYRVRGGSAHTPGDFTLTEGLLEWADGDDSDKTFVIDLVDDRQDEHAESLVLVLEAHTPGVDVHPGQGLLAIEILDND
jgi:hypothetical protein